MNSPATSWAGPTAERILEAAHNLFSEVGFDATKMESVARAARISRPTLYGYYRSKEELYQAVLAREGALLQRKMAGIDLAGDPVAVLRSFIGMLFDEFVAGAHFSIIYRMSRNSFRRSGGIRQSEAALAQSSRLRIHATTVDAEESA